MDHAHGYFVDDLFPFLFLTHGKNCPGIAVTPKKAVTRMGRSGF
jgi:hypothetical protein